MIAGPLIERLRTGSVALRNYDEPGRTRITIRAGLLREVAADADAAATAIAALVEERDEARATVEERGQVIGVPSWQYADLYRRLYAAEAERDAMAKALRDWRYAYIEHLRNVESNRRGDDDLYERTVALLASPDPNEERDCICGESGEKDIVCAFHAYEPVLDTTTAEEVK